MFAAEIKTLTGIDPLQNPCFLHYCKNLESYNFKDSKVTKLIGNIAQLLQESKFDKYVQGNFSALWDIYKEDHDIECESIKKPYGSRKFGIIFYET